MSPPQHLNQDFTTAVTLELTSSDHQLKSSGGGNPSQKAEKRASKKLDWQSSKSGAAASMSKTTSHLTVPKSVKSYGNVNTSMSGKANMSKPNQPTLMPSAMTKKPKNRKKEQNSSSNQKSYAQ